jgi:hypothetical protein
MGMYVLTTEFFGYLKMPGEYSSLAEAINQAVNWKLKTIVNHVPIPASEFITRDNSTPTDTVGMDKVSYHCFHIEDCSAVESNSLIDHFDFEKWHAMISFHCI